MNWAQSVQHEINEQLWKPFIQAFESRNTEGFMALHSKGLVRSIRDEKIVWNWEEYYQNEKKYESQKDFNARRLELRFTERLVGKDQAVEVGIYKTTVTNKHPQFLRDLSRCTPQGKRNVEGPCRYGLFRRKDYR